MASPHSGVSFLGAGTIIRHRGSGYIEGLTTAASVLFASAIGMAVALSQGLLAIGVTVLVLIILRGLNYVRRQLVGRQTDRPNRGAEAE